MSLALSCDLYLLEDLCHWPRRVTCFHWRIYVIGLVMSPASSVVSTFVDGYDLNNSFIELL